MLKNCNWTLKEPLMMLQRLDAQRAISNASRVVFKDASQAGCLTSGTPHNRDASQAWRLTEERFKNLDAQRAIDNVSKIGRSKSN